MHSIIQRWLASALFAGLLLAGASLAQPPAQKEGAPKGITPATPVSVKGIARATPLGVEDIVERIMAFDKNKDGKVTKDELPERMHHLLEQGDTNKDGALDKDEIRKLATRLAATRGGIGGGPLRVGAGPGPGPGPGIPGGFGGGIATRVGRDPVEGVVDDLKLLAGKKEQAMAAAKAHQENVRRLMDQARAELLEKMKEILSNEELEDFRAALDRPRGDTVFAVGPRDTPRGGVQKKSEQPQK
jgi:hypothetical protein